MRSLPEPGAGVDDGFEGVLRELVCNGGDNRFPVICPLINICSQNLKSNGVSCLLLDELQGVQDFLQGIERKGAGKGESDEKVDAGIHVALTV